jgi:tetratricopeptide (TPR) repeat protein
MVEEEILLFNKSALEKLREDDTNAALNMLNDAQEALKQISTDSPIWGITFNNLGCYFKKVGDLETALKHFEKALEIETKRPGNVITVAGTHLNISSVLSQLNFHEKALLNSQKALALLSSSKEKDQNLWISLVISHHSIGKEYEYLNKIQEAVNIYRIGLEISKEKLGKNHKLTFSIKKNLENCMSFISSSAFMSARSKRPKNFEYRSHSSNPNSRIRLPKVSKRLITPTKMLSNTKNNQNTSNKLTPVPNKQVSVLNSLVREIEQTLDHKKYIFRKKNERYKELKDCDNFESNIEFPDIKRANGHVELNPNNWLTIIPESNEDTTDIANAINKNL